MSRYNVTYQLRPPIPRPGMPLSERMAWDAGWLVTGPRTNVWFKSRPEAEAFARRKEEEDRLMGKRRGIDPKGWMKK